MVTERVRTLLTEPTEGEIVKSNPLLSFINIGQRGRIVNITPVDSCIHVTINLLKNYPECWSRTVSLYISGGLMDFLSECIWLMELYLYFSTTYTSISIKHNSQTESSCHCLMYLNCLHLRIALNMFK